MTTSKNFDSCCFKLNLPIITRNTDGLQVSLLLTFKSGNREDVILNNLIIKNGQKNHDSNIKHLCKNSASECRIAFKVPYTGNLPGSRFYFEFISSGGKMYEVVYKIANDKKVQLESISTSSGTKSLFNSLLNDCPEKPKEIQASLAEYKKAVLREMYYLKDEGGRAYKINNGKFISVVDNLYSYGFDLETELSLSEDSPVTIHLTSKKVNGLVLTSEGFHIVLLLNEFIGEKIDTAHISAEPWKLLQALHNRLDLISTDHVIANKLIDNKCNRKGSIDNLSIGQDTAIRMSQTNPIEIIWGPPGTGKTYTMAQIAMNFLRQGKTVLMVSHSNISVDGFVIELVDKIRETDNTLNLNYLQTGKILRYGCVKSEKLINDEEAVSFNYAPNCQTNRNSVL
ncbi:MAG: AAA domain-containing protein [Erysipelotrichaceae bacterium]|nr:AAA domain-containing protein [Erysipelotrichaceae bacterium]